MRMPRAGPASRSAIGKYRITAFTFSPRGGHWDLVIAHWSFLLSPDLRPPSPGLRCLGAFGLLAHQLPDLLGPLHELRAALEVGPAGPRQARFQQGLDAAGARRPHGPP